MALKDYPSEISSNTPLNHFQPQSKPFANSRTSSLISGTLSPFPFDKILKESSSLSVPDPHLALHRIHRRKYGRQSGFRKTPSDFDDTSTIRTDLEKLFANPYPYEFDEDNSSVADSLPQSGLSNYRGKYYFKHTIFKLIIRYFHIMEE